jgi:hypothetical protein
MLHRSAHCAARDGVNVTGGEVELYNNGNAANSALVAFARCPSLHSTHILPRRIRYLDQNFEIGDKTDYGIVALERVQ